MGWIGNSGRTFERGLLRNQGGISLVKGETRMINGSMNHSADLEQLRRMLGGDLEKDPMNRMTEEDLTEHPFLSEWQRTINRPKPKHS
jgi:serine/threonine protein kinase